MILLPPQQMDELQCRALRDLHDDLLRGWHAKTAIALTRQQRLAAEHERMQLRHSEALGELTMVIDPVIYEEMRRRHGEKCWRDPDFRRAMCRDNPELRARSVARKTTVRVQGRAHACTGGGLVLP